MSLYAVTFTTYDFSEHRGGEIFPTMTLGKGGSIKTIINFTDSISEKEYESSSLRLTSKYGTNTSLQGFVSTYKFLNIKFLDTQYGNSLDVVTKYRLSLDVIGNQTVFPMTLEVYDSAGKELSPSQSKSSESHILRVDLGEITQLGAYRIDEYYTGSEPLYTSTYLTVSIEQTQRPLVYYGLIGVVTSITYLLITSVVWHKRRKKGQVTKG